MLLLLVFIIIINVLQSKKPNWLPQILRNWNFLPLQLRSLKPYDDQIKKLCRCKFMNKVEPFNELTNSSMQIVVEFSKQQDTGSLQFKRESPRTLKENEALKL